MYNTGLVKFLQAKKVKSNDAINGFLEVEGIVHFTARHHQQVNSYLQKNWTKFATFVDKSIKSGKLKGQAVKLNSYYDEQEARKKAIQEEFERVSLSEKQQLLLNFIKNHGANLIQQFLIKKGVVGLGKDTNFLSKKLQWLPLVNKAIEAGFDLSEENLRK